MKIQANKANKGAVRKNRKGTDKGGVCSKERAAVFINFYKALKTKKLDILSIL